MAGNIATLEREEFEKKLGINTAGWHWLRQEIEPIGAYGGGMLRVTSCAEVYRRFTSARHGDPQTREERLEIWWISPQTIGKVVKNGKQYPNPSEQVIRMLVK